MDVWSEQYYSLLLLQCSRLEQEFSYLKGSFLTISSFYRLLEIDLKPENLRRIDCIEQLVERIYLCLGCSEVIFYCSDELVAKYQYQDQLSKNMPTATLEQNTSTNEQTSTSNFFSFDQVGRSVGLTPDEVLTQSGSDKLNLSCKINSERLRSASPEIRKELISILGLTEEDANGFIGRYFNYLHTQAMAKLEGREADTVPSNGLKVSLSDMPTSSPTSRHTFATSLPADYNPKITPKGEMRSKSPMISAVVKEVIIILSGETRGDKNLACLRWLYLCEDEKARQVINTLNSFYPKHNFDKIKGEVDKLWHKHTQAASKAA